MNSDFFAEAMFLNEGDPNAYRIVNERHLRVRFLNRKLYTYHTKSGTTNRLTIEDLCNKLFISTVCESDYTFESWKNILVNQIEKKALSNLDLLVFRSSRGLKKYLDTLKQ